MRSVTLFIMVMLALSISHWAEATSFTYEGDKLPWDDGWSIGSYASYKDHASIENDDGRSVLHIKDDLLTLGSALWMYKTWDILPDGWFNSATFVFLNIESSNTLNLLGAYFGIGMIDSDDNQYYQFYIITPSSIVAYKDGSSYSIDTTSGYNTYTTMLYQGTATLWVNGQLAFSNPASAGLYNGVNGVQFGAGSSGAIGNVLWDYIEGSQAPIPEPTTIILFGSGIVFLLGVCFSSRRKRK